MSEKSLDLRIGQTNEAYSGVMHVDDPRLKYMPRTRENGCWDYSHSDKRLNELESQKGSPSKGNPLLKQIENLESQVADLQKQLAEGEEKQAEFAEKFERIEALLEHAISGDTPEAKTAPAKKAAKKKTAT